MSANRNYFDEITRKIDLMEHPELGQIPDTYGEVDGNSSIIPVPSLGEVSEPQYHPNSIETNIADIQNQLPTIDADRIDGVISLYKELTRQYGAKFDADKITSISETYKAIQDPTKKEIFVVLLREHIDRLHLVCLSQLSNTVYSLIAKLTSEETLRSLTISEKVALLDRLFEYMDKINNMTNLLPKGDTSTELREIAQRQESEEIEGPTGSDSKGGGRNRELEKYILGLLSGKS